MESTESLWNGYFFLVNQPSPTPQPNENWRDAVRDSLHSILWLLLLNAGATLFYGCVANRWLAPFVLGFLLPGGFLIVIGQTLRLGLGRTNQGGWYPRKERPVAYWAHVMLLFGCYVAATAVFVSMGMDASIANQKRANVERLAPLGGP